MMKRADRHNMIQDGLAERLIKHRGEKEEIILNNVIKLDKSEELKDINLS
jgi:hypothetical protein